MIHGMYAYTYLRKNIYTLFLISLTTVTFLHGAKSQNCSLSNNTLIPRSFGSYSSREIMLEKSYFESGQDDHLWNGTLSFATDYMQNFGCPTVGALPFWSGTNTMTIGNNNGKADIDAYQFGLGDIPVNQDGIAGTITLDPKIQQIGTQFLFYVTEKKDKPSLFFKVNASFGAMMVTCNVIEKPAVDSSDALGFTQTTNPGEDTITYEWTDYPTPERRYASLSDAFFGGTDSCNVAAGNIYKPIRLEKGRIDPFKNTEVKLGDLSATVGYNFIADDHKLFGVGIKASAPTSNAPTCDYMLEPLFGRSGFWGIGGEIMSYYRHNICSDDHRFFDVWLQGEVMHLIQGRSPNLRSFDLKQNGPGSKYLLIQYYPATYVKDPITNITSQISEANFIQQAINLTTLPVISHIAVEGSVAFMGNYVSHNWSFGIGAEFWGRSSEKLCMDTATILEMRIPNLQDFAVLGRQISAYSIDKQSTTVVSSYCEPLARINQSQDPVILQGATPTVTTPASLPAGIADATIAANRIPAEFSEALDICGAQAVAVMSGKIFGQLAYTWNDYHLTPSLSLFSGVEFVDKKRHAIQNWNIGLQGNINF